MIQNLSKSYDFEQEGTWMLIIPTCLVKPSQCMLILLIINNPECFFCTNDVTGISVKGTLVRLYVTVKWCMKAGEFSIIIIHMSIWLRVNTSIIVL